MLSNFIIHKIIENAGKYPERNALHANGKYYNYKEFTRIVSSIKKKIIENGYNSEDIIGVLTGDDVHTYASIIAILAVGAAYVPINENNPADRNSTIINDTKLRLILASKTHDDLTMSLEKVDRDVQILYVQNQSASDSNLDCVEVDPNQIFYLLFTSGSTGKPKGVPIYHRNLNSFMSIMLDQEIYSFNKDDRFLQMFQLSFDMSVVSFFTPLCLGACCYVVPNSGIAYLNIVRTMEEHEITVAFMVPSVLSYLERFFDELNLGSMRYSIFAGEPLLQGLAEKWSKCIPNALIHNSYGPSETTIVCFGYDWDEFESQQEAVNGIVSFGKPFRNTNSIVLDDELRPVPIGKTGELCIWGDQVTDQYWNNAEKSQQVFIKLPSLGINDIAYLTGDLCYVNSNGNYIFCGRKDFQIKIDGHRIELEEIEHLARNYTRANLAAAIPVTDSNGTVSLNLYVESNAVNSEDLVKYLNSKLPAYMVPKYVYQIDSMPLSQNGKIDRNKLSEL